MVGPLRRSHNTYHCRTHNVHQVASAVQAKYGDTDPILGMASGATHFQRSFPKSSLVKKGKLGRKRSQRSEMWVVHLYGPRFEMGISQLGFAESL